MKNELAILHDVHCTMSDYMVVMEDVFMVSSPMCFPRASVPELWRDKFENDPVWCFQGWSTGGGTSSSHSFMFDNEVLCEMEQKRFVKALEMVRRRYR